MKKTSQVWFARSEHHSYHEGDLGEQCILSAKVQPAWQLPQIEVKAMPPKASRDTAGFSIATRQFTFFGTGVGEGTSTLGKSFI